MNEEKSWRQVLQEGIDARRFHKPRTRNPYAPKTLNRYTWDSGWEEVERLRQALGFDEAANDR